MDPVVVLRGIGSVARIQHLGERGISKTQITSALNNGQLVRLRKGVVALPDAPADFATAVVNTGLLTCSSAAKHYGLWLLHPPKAHHLSCPGRSTVGSVNHQRRTVPRHARLPLVGVVDVLIHALQCLPPVEAAIIVESSLRRGDTVRSFLVERLPGNRNGGARAALNLVTGCAESPIEVVARILFRSVGLHVQTQVQIDGVGRVDFLLEGFLVVEADGDKYHSDRKARRNDRRRNNMTIVGGYPVLRYGYEDIVFDQKTVLEQVHAVLSGRVMRRW